MREYLWVSYSHLFLINQQPALWPSGVEYEKGFTEGADMEPPRKFTLSRVDSANIDRPIWGTVVCAGLGGLLVLYLQIPSPLTGDFGSIAIGAGAAGFLGWVGWTWAKHVYFWIHPLTKLTPGLVRAVPPADIWGFSVHQINFISRSPSGSCFPK